MRLSCVTYVVISPPPGCVELTAEFRPSRFRRGSCLAAPLERFAEVLVARNALKLFLSLVFLLGYFIKLERLLTDTPYGPLSWLLRYYRYFFLPGFALRLSWRLLRGEACAATTPRAESSS